jgi:signal peptidase II
VRNRPRLLGFFFAAAVFAYALDRLTKYLVEHHLAARGPLVLIPHVLDLRYTTNSGGAFGILGSEPWLFFGATILVSAVIVVAAFRVDSSATLLGLGLILGGALGNLTDRVGHARVTDSIDFPVWPVFNAADSAIVIRAIVVALAGTRRSNA